MKPTTTLYTECPQCLEQWDESEKRIQACTHCLFMTMPSPADTVDIDPETFNNIAEKVSYNAEKPKKQRVKRP